MRFLMLDTFRKYKQANDPYNEMKILELWIDQKNFLPEEFILYYSYAEKRRGIGNRTAAIQINNDDDYSNYTVDSFEQVSEVE